MGGVAAIASAVNVSRQTVYNWLEAGIVAPGSIFAVYDATGVSIHDLNPVVYPRERVTART